MGSKSSESFCCYFFFFFQAEDGIRDQPRSRGLGDVYKRQERILPTIHTSSDVIGELKFSLANQLGLPSVVKVVAGTGDNAATALANKTCLLYTSDAADDTPCVDLRGRRIIKKKKKLHL
ncbi:hypothetical protein [Lactobacillus rhamnosus DSM 14870] [Lacticaseibacillus rhamnosus]|nr:hypothetical protein [Lactobacillus rhamnosus DSM 14870] [Lacticaseibacillus rhamnosus]